MPDERQRAADSGLVEPCEQPRDGVGARRRCRRARREAEHRRVRRGTAAPGRAATQRGSRSPRRCSSRRRSALRPPARQLGSKWLSTARQGSSRKTYTARAMAKVEKKRAGHRGDAARLPARDAPDPPLRGEGRGAVPRRRPARLPARRDRPGGGRGRRLPGDGGGRRLRLDAPRARPHARARHAPERA